MKDFISVHSENGEGLLLRVSSIVAVCESTIYANVPIGCLGEDQVAIVCAENHATIVQRIAETVKEKSEADHG